MELILVGKMLTRDSRNFHGWGYRRKVVSELESSGLNGVSLVEPEFEYTTKMVKSDLSNFSAWHNRSKLIPRLLNQRNADDATRRKFLDAGMFHPCLYNSSTPNSDVEFELITEAIYTDAYPYAQSVWFYHQFLMTTLVETAGYATFTPNFTQQDRIDYIAEQLISLKDMLDGAEDCKWIYNALLEYTLAVCQMAKRQRREDEKQDCNLWLVALRKLDPLRSRRWDDVENTLL